MSAYGIGTCIKKAKLQPNSICLYSIHGALAFAPVSVLIFVTDSCVAHTALLWLSGN